MRVVMFYHSVVSDWNNRNAHFLRGIITEMTARGHDVTAYEPKDGWSRQNLLAEQGREALRKFRRAYPHIRYKYYNPASIDLDEALKDAELVLVHEWNDAELAEKIGSHRRKKGRYRLFFHDTRHRSQLSSDSMSGYGLEGFDGALVNGAAVRDIYLSRGIKNVSVWHEAADVRIFRPMCGRELWGDLVWVGNWDGEEERISDLMEFLIEPVKALGLKARVYGVNYTEEALREVQEAGMEYGGWLPNFEVPQVLSRYKFTVHIPRALSGIPTIRPFEALACGTPLICAPWRDAEGLFEDGRDYLIAKNGKEMTSFMAEMASDAHLREMLSERGLMTVLTKHTCGHRVNELMKIMSAGRVVKGKKAATKELANAGDRA